MEETLTQYNLDDLENMVQDDFEKYDKRKKARKPRGKLRLDTLKQDGQATTDTPDTTLHRLQAQGYIDEILLELKSGKEATVYLARSTFGLVAAKVYLDRDVRSFQNDNIYRQGRRFTDAQYKYAEREKQRTGADINQTLWIFHEYAQLWAFYDAGLPIPKPLVGPGADEYMRTGRVVLMEYLGDEDGPAPRLADVHLSEDEAQRAWQESLDILMKMLKLGKIHGDYSTYNLLWWQDQVYVIDFPQVVNISDNPAAMSLLERDVRSLCKSFRSHGIDAHPDDILRDVKQVLK